MIFLKTIHYLLRRLLFPTSPRTMELHMLRLLNKDRKKNGLKPLFMQDDLREVARKHSRDMARQDYFSHTNLIGQSPGDRLKGARITEAVAGENLAKIGGFALPTVRAEVGLMNSPGHRTNILNEIYNCVGIGVIKSTTKIYYFTQNFARRELLLSKNPKSKIKQSKGLLLKGKTLAKVPEILIEIQGPSKKTKRHLMPIHDQKFKGVIAFSEVGRNHIRLYVPHAEQYRLSNEFEILVK